MAIDSAGPPIDFAAKLSVTFVIINCVAAPEELRRRLIQRKRLALDASEADVLILERQLATAEVLSGEEQAPLSRSRINWRCRTSMAAPTAAMFRARQHRSLILAG
jgi:predicted kinase